MNRSFASLVRPIKQKIMVLAERVKEAIIQDCPPEYSACEYCRRPQCTISRSLTCTVRLESIAEVRPRKYLKSGQAALLR